MRRVMVFCTMILLSVSLVFNVHAAEPEIVTQRSLQEEESTARPIGLASETILAHYQPGLPLICAIQPGETILAIAQTDGEPGYYLIYAGGLECEGRVWVEQSAPISWQSSTELADLPEIELPAAPEIIDDLPEYATLCELATDASAEQSSVEREDLHSVYMPGSWSFFPPEFVATQDGGIDVVVCVTPQEESLGICSNVALRVERVREDALVTLIHYATQTIIAQETFNGPAPADCPSAATQESIVRGNPPDRVVWASWVMGQIVGAERDNGRLRSITNVGQLNARAAPDRRSEIYTVLNRDTPINLIARTEDGAWALALLPDMTQAWLFVELIQIAVQTDLMALPVAEGNAAEISIAIE